MPTNRRFYTFLVLLEAVLLLPHAALCYVPSWSTATQCQSTTNGRSIACVRATSTQLGVDGQGMAGGSRHLLGNALRALQPRYLSQVSRAVQSQIKGMPTVQVESFCNFLEECVPSWEEISTQLAEPQPSPADTLRLFGADAPVVTLYRDSAAWCPYCQKVWIALEETQIPYKVDKVDMTCYGNGKPLEFLKVQPNGNLPCAILHGSDEDQIVGESNDIMDLLDELASTVNRKPSKVVPQLRPPDQEDRIRDLCDNGPKSLERRLYSRWMWWLTGVRKPQEYKEIFLENWQEMEDALKDGPYFLGKELSIVDLRFIPFVERQLASLIYFKGAAYLRDPSRYPNIVRWFNAMESRPSYQATKSDFYTHSRALPPQLSAGCAAEAGCEEMQQAIDSLPTLDGSSDSVEPGWEWVKHPEKEAAMRVASNHAAIVSFAARGAGIAGLPAASAPLADPSASPNEQAKRALDSLLRMVVSSLLNSESLKVAEPVILNAMECLDEESSIALADSLDYLRERIGVPRDMSFPAAQCLRSQLLSMSQRLRLRQGQSQQLEHSSMQT